MDTNLLSDREIEVLQLVGQGKSNKEIAMDLDISVNTVKVHLSNIFKKLNVSSRTEATIYAIEHGMVEIPHLATEELESTVFASNNKEPTAWEAVQKRYWLIILSLVVGLLIGLSMLMANSHIFASPTSTPNAIVDSLSQERWTYATAIPQPRAEMAVATTQNFIYLISGVTSEGVSSLVQKFDRSTNIWMDLTEKPTAVSDANATIVGGKIFVPGGILADGTVTDIFEVYTPDTDTWETRSPIPFPLSNYGIASFEGKIFIFGGWDGSKELDTVLKYEPYSDKWESVTNLPSARANPSVVLIDDLIYVIGGESNGTILKVIEVYAPNQDIAGGKPWSSQVDLPEDFDLVGAQNVMGSLFIFGRSSDDRYTLLNFTPQNKVWSEYTESSPIEVPVSPRVAILGGDVYFIGGYDEIGKLTDSIVRYQAVYTVILPRIGN